MTNSELPAILENLLNSDSNTTHFDETWSQGRSAFGGLSAAFAVTGMRKLMHEEKPLRSLMVSFIAPLPPGEVSVTAKILRQGKNVVQMSADVISGGEICLQAMGIFGSPRPGLMVEAESRPNPVPRDQGIAFADHAKRLPAFLSFFEGYWVSEGLPFSGNPARHLNLWARHRTPMSNFPVEQLVTIADIPPPVILNHFDKPPVPSSSLTWSLEFVVAPESIKDEWFYLEFTTEAAADGYTQQSGKIFDEQGRLCALSRQCMVYFG